MRKLMVGLYSLRAEVGLHVVGVLVACWVYPDSWWARLPEVAWFPALVAGFVIGRVTLLLFVAAGSVSTVRGSCRMCMWVLSQAGCHYFLGCLCNFSGGPYSFAVTWSCPCGSRSACLWSHAAPLVSWWDHPCLFWCSLWHWWGFFDFLEVEVGLVVVAGGIWMTPWHPQLRRHLLVLVLGCANCALQSSLCRR